MKRKPTRAPGVVIDETQLQALIEKLRPAIKQEIRDSFYILRLETLAYPKPVVPIKLCEELYAVIVQVARTAPFTSARLVEEAKESTVDAMRLREALRAVLSWPVTTRKLTSFLSDKAARVAGPWRLEIVNLHANDGRLFRVYPGDEK